MVPIGFVIIKTKKMLFFDSFGLDPPIKLQEYLNYDNSIKANHTSSINFLTS